MIVQLACDEAKHMILIGIAISDKTPNKQWVRFEDGDEQRHSPVSDTGSPKAATKAAAELPHPPQPSIKQVLKMRYCRVIYNFQELHNLNY